jgi:membrane protein YqaA with SNARE-associated domain
MTAIIYFGEMLVVSVLAIFLLEISPLRVAAAAASFAGGVVAWTLAEYLVHRFVLHDLAPIMPIPMSRSLQFFGRFGFVSRWSI